MRMEAITIKKSEALFAAFSKIQYRIAMNDKRPHTFGTEQALHQSEIHFIDAVGPGTGVNATCAAQKLGITKGAVTQIADKLVKKGFVEKYKKPDNKKEVYIKLTSDGEIAYNAHRSFHKQLEDKMFAYLDELDETQMQVLFGLVDVIDQNLPDVKKEKSL